MVSWPHDGIVPVELWDVLDTGKTLFARRDEASFFASLASAVVAARAGTAMREIGERVPSLAWDTVAIAGGGVDEPRARAAFQAAGVDVALISTDVMFAVEGARALVRAIDPLAVVVDAGQTAVKASGPGGSVVRPRPSVDDLAGEIAAAIRATADMTTSFVLLALPCEVTTRPSGLTLGASTYATEGDGALLVAEIARRAALPSARIAAVNDAVLAAQVVAHRLANPESCLVLTVGHGVGAAWILGSMSREAP